MARRDARHGRASLVVLVVLVLAGLLVAAGSVTWLLRPDAPLPGDLPADPAAVPAPPGLVLPPVTAPDVVADALPAAAGADPALVRRALAPVLEDPDLGRHVLASVSDLTTGRTVYTRGRGAAVPASTTKLLTAAAALTVLEPDHVFETRVLAAGRRVTLVGGGDPLLASGPDGTTYPRRADVVTLARAAARSLRQQDVARVRLTYDDSLFSGPDVNPFWPDDYVPDGVVAPITALWVDGGRPGTGFGRVEDPSLTAAIVFAGALSRAGIAVNGFPRPARAPAAAQEVASVSSATLAQLVEHVLLVSDNEATEVLARHVGIATSGSGSFAAGMLGVLSVLRGLDVPTRGVQVYDGSGLSRDNRITTAALTGVLRAAARSDRLRPVLTGLPVAGFTGSLTYRFEDVAPVARGRVRAKTGTLSGVSSLAGVATGRDGTPMAFVLMADRVTLEDTLDARDALDAAAAALGACRCGRRVP